MILIPREDYLRLKSLKRSLDKDYEPVQDILDLEDFDRPKVEKYNQAMVKFQAKKQREMVKKLIDSNIPDGLKKELIMDQLEQPTAQDAAPQELVNVENSPNVLEPLNIEESPNVDDSKTPSNFFTPKRKTKFNPRQLSASPLDLFNIVRKYVNVDSSGKMYKDGKAIGNINKILDAMTDEKPSSLPEGSSIILEALTNLTKTPKSLKNPQARQILKELRQKGGGFKWENLTNF